MAFEMLVGLEVLDDVQYEKYREQMKPILAQHGGGFNFDFKVSELLISQENPNINRVFTIYFEDENAMERFFNHPQYLSIKQTHFEGAVKSTTIISSYHT